MSLRFHIDWLAPAGPSVRSPAEAATWARIELQLGETPISELLDENDSTVRRGFFGSLWPLTEWLVESWPRIIHERRAPPRGGPEWFEWIGWHDLRAGRGGGAMPRLTIRRISRHAFLVTATADEALPPGIRVRFLRSAQGRVPASEIERELARVVESTLVRAAQSGDARVADARRRWQDARAPLAEAAARLGVDSSALSAGEQTALAEILADAQSGVLLSLAEGSTSTSVTEKLADARLLSAQLPAMPEEPPAWTSLATRVAPPSHPLPWWTGWSAAERFREVLELAPSELSGRTLGRVLEDRCGWSGAHHFRPLAPAGGIDTIHFHRQGRTPVVLTERTASPARRFRLATAVYHLLFAATSGTIVATDSPLLQDCTREARAFAAELLAPVSELRRLAPPNGYWTLQACRAAARTLGVSPKVIQHQVENRHLGLIAAA